jgi:hypothetical protein
MTQINYTRALKLLAELRDIDLGARARRAITLAEKQRRIAIARELHQIALAGQKPQDGSENRRDPRARVKLRVLVVGGPRPIELQTENVAVGGVSVGLPFTPRVGDLLALRLIPPEPDEPFEAMGEVVWFHPVRQKAGLRFHDLGDGGRGVIERMIYGSLFNS